ncbi:MAG: hypothetical protein EFT35_00465 [Methanophagales archaeon ANME-1-THS]|nr:MAG: hypothetical protein EFT35_00465 [Methanophagales archaeon ANME-1-THS]
MLAKENGCTHVEIPADFIKNKTEVALTCLDLGAFLDRNAINALYEKNAPDYQAKYILHTEPSLTRTDSYGLRHQSQLSWHNPKWVENLVTMIVDICNHFGTPATAVEIHPGDRRNSHRDIVNGCYAILEGFQNSFSYKPTILLENRTGQFISTGADLRAFWSALRREGHDTTKNVGIVLDIQQLFTSTQHRFIEELQVVPRESIKALHIHAEHRTPSLGNKIPWLTVFDWMRTLPQTILINPEVHHKNQVPETISFCREHMKRTSPIS